jgi:anti-anti-sigma regulatory factor
MATPVQAPGLLHKVAKFVRNPTTDWADLDKIETKSVERSEASSDPISTNHRQALKNVVERKRHDDEIRKREFDYLRQLRRNDSSITPDMVAQAFCNTTDYFELDDDRSGTLKKIDEIEAQMSKQWWKSHPDSAPAVLAASTASSDGTSSRSDDWRSRPTAQVMLDSFASTILTQPDEDVDDVPTRMGPTAPVGTAPRYLDSQTDSHVDRSPPSDFDLNLAVPSTLSAAEDVLSDPELEEAAIRFANADDAGAEDVLRAALGSNGDASVGDIWFAALFDLYRCTDQRAKFDALALDYAQRWGQSAPLWFSIPERWAKGSGVRQPVSETPVQEQCMQWQCPSLLDMQALASLREAAASDSSVMVIDWSGLTQIAPSAAQSLADLVAQWCEQTQTWHFEAVHVLLNLLRLATPVSNNEIEAHWWYLRLDMLRMLQMQDDYELAALDYCVTFEVSPPPWREALCCHMETMTSSASGVPVLTLQGEASVSGNGHVASLLEPDPVPLLEADLGGELLGDMAQTLLPSEQHFRTAHTMVISCSDLIRVDFSAAGSILNWATMGQAMGCRIEFVDVARLVAVFFNLIGISEHARVVVRTM